MMPKISNFFNSKITIPQNLNKSYIPELDGLRGLAIIVVIVSHIVITTPLGKYFNGNIGVEMFFVLSGFLITTLLLKEQQKKGKISFKNFYIRRALRILPVAYLFLVVLLLLNYLLKLNITVTSFITSAIYLKNIPFHNSTDWFTGHFWTLAIEEQFYLIFPFLLIYNINNYIRITFFLLISIPMLRYVGYNNIGIFYTWPLLHKVTISLVILFGNGTTSILAGSLLSILMFKNPLIGKNRNINRFLSLIILALAILFHTVSNDLIYGTYLSSTIFSIVLAVVIFLIIINKNDFLGTLLRNKFLVKVGILSYSFYIWQQIFTRNQPWEHLFKYSDSLLLNIPALFIVAYLSYTFYEKPFLKLKERFK